jgi:hypothetical protein
MPHDFPEEPPALSTSPVPLRAGALSTELAAAIDQARVFAGRMRTAKPSHFSISAAMRSIFGTLCCFATSLESP